MRVPPGCDGQRLDAALSALCQEYSRSRLQAWIKQGLVRINDATVVKPRHPVHGGDDIALLVPDAPSEQSPEGEAMELDVIYQDEALLVINKAPGMVVHPGAGHGSGTLVNALLHHDPKLQGLPRAGLVHRLDKDTSGLLLVARKLDSHNTLVKQMRQRHIKRFYQAIVKGRVPRGATVDAALGRDPRHRTKIAVRAGGRAAVTRYKLAERFGHHTMLNVQLETGRTHQIRVHLAWKGHPVLGDPLYGRHHHTMGKEPLHTILKAWRRQALHAWQLRLAHPTHGAEMKLQCEAPADMQQLLAALRQHDPEQLEARP